MILFVVNYITES